MKKKRMFNPRWTIRRKRNEKKKRSRRSRRRRGKGEKTIN